MHGEFNISQCYEISGTGLVLAGEVINGEISEGAWGATLRGKKFSIVKIEQKGYKKHTARKKDKINLYAKYLRRSDVRPGETVYFD